MPNIIPGFEVNRAAIVIRAQQPFLDWLNQLPDSKEKFTFLEVNSEPTIYLVPEDESDGEYILEWIEAYKKDLFDRALEDWCTDAKFWPKNRSIKVFNKWFKVEVHSMVIDLVSNPIKRKLF